MNEDRMPSRRWDTRDERPADYDDRDPDASPRSRGVALALCTVLGVFGGHRFYAGKVGTGILQACTLGGLGMWWLYDFVLVATGVFKDSDGRRISEWAETDGRSDSRRMGGPDVRELLGEINLLREEVHDLTERVEFTERLLADPGRRPTARQ